MLWGGGIPKTYISGSSSKPFKNLPEKKQFQQLEWICRVTIWLITHELFSRSVVSDPLQPHGLQHASLPSASLSPGVCSNSCPLSWRCHPTITHHRGAIGMIKICRISIMLFCSKTQIKSECGILSFIKSSRWGTSLVGQWLREITSTTGGWGGQVRSLDRELRSCMPVGSA